MKIKPVIIKKTTKYQKCCEGEYKYIFHFADIHIDPTKRHEEYQYIFNQTYNQIDQISQIRYPKCCKEGGGFVLGIGI